MSERKNRNRNFRLKKKIEIKDLEPISDDYFAFIAGYTSNGFAYGITHEELSEIQNNNESDNTELI